MTRRAITFDPIVESKPATTLTYDDVAKLMASVNEALNRVAMQSLMTGSAFVGLSKKILDDEAECRRRLHIQIDEEDLFRSVEEDLFRSVIRKAER